MNSYQCNNCGDIQHDKSNPDDLKESDLICGHCHNGYYEYKGSV